MIPLPVLNTQPVEKQKLDAEGKLDVVDIFCTIQGEGPFAGRPAVFVRLAGCNLSRTCKACDTDYTSNRRTYTADELKNEVLAVDRHSCGLVVITGGEPFRQNITPFAMLMIMGRWYQVQVETNGTLYLPGFPYWVAKLVCSPKTPKINQQLKKYIHHLKYIIADGKVAEDGLPTSSLDSGLCPARPWPTFNGTVWVQPQDDQDPEKNTRNTKAAVESVMKSGCRQLCLQVHKMVNLP